jgi:hypothetical protein
MADFIQTARRNLKQDPISTIAVTLGLAAALFVIFTLIASIIGMWFIALISSIPLTIFLATRVRQLGWYFGVNLGDRETTYLEAQAVDVLPFTLVPRATPKGTKLVDLSDAKAVFTVKAVIHFWNWFLPLNFATLAFISMPVAATLSYINDATSRDFLNRRIVENMGQDAAVSFGVFAVLAVLSYFLTRPNVRVVVKPDTIKVGSYRFDRRYVGGFREGFKSQGVETRWNFSAPKFGSTNLYMEYGAWGERMKYLVPAESAVEIVVWANAIIDRIGKSDAAAPAASEGIKTEML